MTTKNSTIVFDHDTVMEDRAVYSNNSKVIVTNGATVTFAKGAILCDNCLLELKDGSTVKIASGSFLNLGKNSVLDARDGIIDMQGAYCFLALGCTLMLDSYIPKGGGFIAAYRDNDKTLPLDFNFIEGVTFIAPPRKVFGDDTFLEGKWLMPVAYPQWFTDTVCNDWSVPINRAIQMKQAGEVLLPKGNLKVQRSIIVKQGIILRGIPKSHNASTVAISEDSEMNTYSGTLLVAYSDEGTAPRKNNFIFGCMILVNVNPEVINAWRSNPESENLTYEKVIQGNGQVKTPSHPKGVYVGETYSHSVGTVIQDFGIDNTIYKIEHLRGISVVGSASFRTIKFQNLYQAISWANVYSDQKEITKCSVSHNSSTVDPEFSNPSTKISEELPEEYDLPYAFDLGKLGDAILFCQNGVDGEVRNALRVYECGGGVFDANILNADVQIQNCKGISFSNNHLEEGAQMRIIKSSATINGNYMHKGRRENIVIASGKDGQGSEVDLRNNIFVYIQGFTFPTTGGIETADTIGNYDIGIFDSAEYKTGNQRDWIVRNNNIVNIENSFRYWTYHGHFSQMDMFGLKLSNLHAEQKSGNIEIKRYDFDTFNEYSSFLSRKSQLLPFDKVQNYSQQADFSISVIAQATVNPIASDIENGYCYWSDEEGTYRYRTQIYCDILRGLAYPMTSPVDVEIIKGEETSEEDYPNYGKIKKYVTISLPDTALLGMGFFVKITREKLSADKSQVLEEAFVDIPVCSASVLFDYGKDISGFKWEIDEHPRPYQESFYNNEEDLMYNDIISYSMTPGKFVATVSWQGDEFKAKGWRTGDILLNISKNRTWEIKVMNKTYY